MYKLPAPRLSRHSYVKHRQDVVFQIILPVVLAALVMIAIAVLIGSATFQRTGDARTWAAIAAIWIIIPLMGIMLVMLVVACGAIWLLSRLIKISPHYTGTAQEYALRFNAQIVQWTDRIIQPILNFKAWVSLITRQK